MNPHLRDRIHGYLADSLPEEELYVLLETVENDPTAARELAEAVDLQGKLRAAAFVGDGDADRLADRVVRVAAAPKFGERVLGRLQRGRRSTRPLLTIAAVLVLAATAAFWWHNIQPETFGEVVAAGVGIDLERDGRRQPVRTGLTLRHGDNLIVSSATESARLRLPDGTEFATEKATAVHLRVVDGARHFHVLQGTLAGDVRPQPAGKPLVLTSAIARATVVGTRLRFAVSDRETRLDVSHGAVEFVNQKEDRVMVEDGEYAVARVGQDNLHAPERMIQPDPAVAAAFQRWQNYGKLIAADPDLIVWYDFQNDADDSLLPARAFRPVPGREGRTFNVDGRITDAVWSDGRFPGLKKGLLFQDQAYVECGRDPAFRVHGPLTVIVWFRVLAFNSDHNCPGSIGYHGWGFQRHRTTRAMEFYFYSDNRYQNAIGSIPVDDDQWHCVAGVFDGQNVSLFIDGKLDATRAVKGARTASIDPLMIGANIDAQGILNRFFQGWIDEWMMFGRALSPEEVRSIYEAGRPPVSREVATGNQ